MKKIIMTVASVFLAGSLSMAAAGTADVGVSAGIGYPDYPDQTSFDMGIFFDYNINPYLAVGLESGFDWVLREYKAGSTPVGSLGALTSKERYNFYSFPLLGMVTVNVPLENTPVTPFLSGGAGYSWTIYKAPDDSWIFHGFTWQVMGGAVIELGEGAMGMKLMAEAGYRGTMVEKSIGGTNVELEMGSPIVRVGVVFPLSQGESDDY